MICTKSEAILKERVMVLKLAMYQNVCMIQYNFRIWLITMVLINLISFMTDSASAS
jgi:hypothetical protein